MVRWLMSDNGFVLTHRKEGNMETKLSKKAIVEVVMKHFETAKTALQEMDKQKCEGREVHPVDYDRACQTYFAILEIVSDLWFAEGGEN